MNKEKRYHHFRRSLNRWLETLEALRKDALEILKNGSIDLTAFPFGQQPYHFHSTGEDLYCRKAYLNENGIFCVEAGANEREFAQGGYALSWEDMCQDTITLSDFLDCLYDNKDLRYDV